MSRNKGVKLAVLSLIGIFSLAGCGESEDSEIYSKPSNYDSSIISIEGNSDEIYHNLLSIIYDAMHEGSLSGNVLDEALYRYAASVFGTYDEVTRANGSTETTLKDAVADITFDVDGNVTGGGDTVKAFIRAHKSYWYYNEEGKHVQEDGTTVINDGADWTPGNTEISHVAAKWTSIETRISESMYAKANSSSYIEKNYFSEVKFLKSLHEDSKKVRNYKTTGTYAVVEDEFIIPYTVEDSEAFDEFVGYDAANHVMLHREYYQSNVSADPDMPKATYIEDEIIPDVYNDLLIEQYLLDEDVAAVRNSRARYINVLKIEKYSSFPNNADMLVKKLVEEIYSDIPAADAQLEVDAETIEEKYDALFEKYALVAKGLYDQITANAAATALVNSLHEIASDIYEPDAKAGMNYYKHTSYGDLVEDYDKIYEVINAADPDWNKLDEDKYSTFTSNGTRSVEEGFEQQKIDLMQAENITKGWYIQSKTPNLDSNGEINNRLFKLSIANAKVELDSTSSEAYADLLKADRVYKADGAANWSVRPEASKDENRFLCSINGAYFLKFDGQSIDADWKNDIVYDDGSAYYIVQVLEAAKDSKLRSVSTTNYAHTRSQTFMDKVIDEVAKIVGETGSYASLSKNHWLEKMDLSYYDQKVYDYFKSNYPDLFED